LAAYSSSSVPATSSSFITSSSSTLAFFDLLIFLRFPAKPRNQIKDKIEHDSRQNHGIVLKRTRSRFPAKTRNRVEENKIKIPGKTTESS
jgi:hypothetical protein